ncbi:hypothetical protein BASA61_008324 [Batrachochytrium salamandrivorans]|nr:hypothetical protein BASA61_008324 [Batrachochytrium salamandrivorans]KAH9252512.1 hypothetical protein BASA81_009555 [Batrachochytrium salamandrivorans]KAH9270951.1 hypothetical protein BASA83_006907 [Batrachochytrium salamandrivorans]
MLTPRFTIVQTDDFVELVLHCPFIKTQDVEIDIDGPEFKFFAHPYYLRLTLPASLLEDGREKSKYDIDKGTVTLTIPKEIPGLHFEDLDMLTKLMGIKPVSKDSAHTLIADLASGSGKFRPLARAPLIQEQDSSSHIDEQPKDEDISATSSLEFDWNYPQQLPEPTATLTGALYGFNNQYSGFSANIEQVANEVLDVKDLDHSTPESRRKDRVESEDVKFDEDYYISEFLSKDEFVHLYKYRPASWGALKQIQLQGQEQKQKHPFLEFTEQDQDQLRQLSNRRYIIDPSMERCIYLGLVDILFGYCYNLRTTEGEDTVESAWTICKLSGTLSCFDTFSSLSEVVSCSLRRSLAFPLNRHIDLTKLVIEDVVILLKLGRRAILKALLHTKRLLERDEITFVLDRVWVTDYCVWIQQQASDAHLKSLASELHRFKITPELTMWPLKALEELAMEDTNSRD